jgi:hypothetical protein
MTVGPDKEAVEAASAAGFEIHGEGKWSEWTSELGKAHFRATSKAAILAFLRHLKDKGPSAGMLAASEQKANLGKMCSTEAWSAMIFELIQDIERK